MFDGPRARAIRAPREVLREFGTHISDDVQVRVHDSTVPCFLTRTTNKCCVSTAPILRLQGLTVSERFEQADCRYLVLPQRPPGTEGWSEQALCDLVTRDSMIGLCPAADPASS
jgi:hypothetical protein